MNPWLWLLIGILVFAPKSMSAKTGRWDLRALALLLCVIAVITQV